METIKTRLEIAKDFLSTLPEQVAVFGVGSALVEQIGIGAEAGQIDLIIVVDDTNVFHKEVIKNTPDYYLDKTKHFFMRRDLKTDTNKLARVIDKFKVNPELLGSGACYIPYINYDNQYFKIGVISKQEFIHDLKSWKNMYMAGRFHKPVVTIKSTEEISEAITYNRKSALIAGLMLINKKKASLYDIYHKVASLSYKGDIRMGIKVGKKYYFAHENPEKVKNIITGNHIEFDNMYLNNKVNENIITNYKQESSNEEGLDRLKSTIVDVNIDKVFASCTNLPLYLLLAIKANNILLYIPNKDIVKNSIRNRIKASVILTNLYVSTIQPLKGKWLILDKTQSHQYLEEKRAKGKVKELSKI